MAVTAVVVVVTVKAQVVGGLRDGTACGFGLAALLALPPVVIKLHALTAVETCRGLRPRACSSRARARAHAVATCVLSTGRVALNVSLVVKTRRGARAPRAFKPRARAARAARARAACVKPDAAKIVQRR